MSNYDVVIGLEVHAQLATQTKLFCGCRVEFGAQPNEHVCPVCLGFPGALPVPNETAIEYAVKLGLATHCHINPKAMWTRKNYFYPDLPKGYQITQQGGTPAYDQPICRNGYLVIPGENGEGDEKGGKKIRINRIHMEEDAGKLVHDLSPGESLFDANRCGTPLLEIVSEPDIRSEKEAVAYLEKLKQILEYLEICDANMEKGNLRCDVNVSLRETPADPLGDRVEIKNMNSFSNLEKALLSEIEHQALSLDKGEKVVQVTKRWDPGKNVTTVMRTKEDAEDYRYFPDPDLLRIDFVNGEYVDKVRQTMPELPEALRQRFREDYGLGDYDAQVLTASKATARYFEAVCAQCKNYKVAANWVLGEVSRVVNETGEPIDALRVTPQMLAGLLSLLEKKEISGRIAKDVFEDMLQSGKEAESIVSEKGLRVVADTGAIGKIIEEVVSANPDQVEAYRGGKTKIFGFFMGQVMKATQGKASPEVVNPMLKKRLEA